MGHTGWDLQPVCPILVKLLEKAHFIVLSAEHGEKALSVLAENIDIAAILMDCQMPVMDGFEATRQIRAMADFEDSPIIAVTANVSEEDQQRCREAGMSDYLTKPANPELIEGTLAKWLIKRQRNWKAEFVPGPSLKSLPLLILTH